MTERHSGPGSIRHYGFAGLEGEIANGGSAARAEAKEKTSSGYECE